MEGENGELILARSGGTVGSLLDQGVQALVLFGDPGEKGLVERAHAKGVPVLGAGEPLEEEGQDFLVTYDPENEGRKQAESLLKKAPQGVLYLMGPKVPTWASQAFQAGQREALQPFVEKGEISITTRPRDLGKVAAFLVFDPKDLPGIRGEMGKKGWSGAKPLAGIGEDLETCRAVLKGAQTVTLYRSPLKLAEESAYLAVKAARKARTFDCQFMNVPHGKGSVRTVLLTPQALDASNLLDRIVKDGIWTKEQLEGKTDH